MAWTRFMDMHSGGRLKESAQYIYVEAPEVEANVIFYNRFGHSPSRVTCTCCGEDYSTGEESSLEEATAYERGCRYAEDSRGWEASKEPDYKPSRYLEHFEQIPAGMTVGSRFGRKEYTLIEWMGSGNCIVIREGEIRAEERTGIVPEQGYVWVG